MTGPALEAFLARLYADPEALRSFLADRAGAAARAGLSEAETSALLAMDEASLRLAADSFAHKRAQAQASKGGTRRRLPLWLRTTLFTLAFPGSALVVVPWLVVRGTGDRLAFDPGAMRWIGWLLVALGFGGYLLCALRFGREGSGTPAPWDAPSSLVGGGLYRWVRNPMYVALVIAVCGEAIALGRGVLLGWAAFVWLAFHVRVLTYEEPVLRRQFGETFERYCRRVPRWLPRPPRAG